MDPVSGEYFLHMFSRKQPDLNWENPEVRQAVFAMMNWWVDRGVDGFRMDVINLISKPTELTDGKLGPDRKYAPCFESIANGHRLEEFLEEMNAAVGLDERNLITVGEMPGSTIATARNVTDPDRHELNMVFTFEHVGLDSLPDGSKFDLRELDLAELKQNLSEWQVGLADVGWNSLYWDNHDQPRAVSRFGDDSPEHRVNSAKTLATVQHMHKGTPYVYQGEEFGMTNTYFTDIGQYQDIESVNYHADAMSLGLEAELVMQGLAARSRDNARTPVQWDDTPQAGFTEGRPWLPVNPNYVTINAAAAVADPDSVFHHFRKLIALRQSHPVIVEGRFELLLPDHRQIWALTRTLGEQLLIMIANCSSEPVTVPDGALPDLWRCGHPVDHARGLHGAAAAAVGVADLPSRIGRTRQGAVAAGCSCVSAAAATRRARSRKGRAAAEPTCGEQVGDLDSPRRLRSCPGPAGRRCRRRWSSASRTTRWSLAAGRGSSRSGRSAGSVGWRPRPAPR